MNRTPRRDTGPAGPPPVGRSRPTGSVGSARRPSRGREVLEMLARAAEELSRLIEAGRVARERRAEARRLVMEAWLATGVAGRARPDVDALRGLLRAVDLVVADPGGQRKATEGPGLLHLSSRTTMIDAGAAAGSRALGRGAAAARIIALERATIAIVHRTESMVEHALATLEQGRAGTTRGPAAPPGGREDLELVWGETEG